uniref:Actin-depolymerizing factor-like n=1 Tax=Rhizophora mucronata TaxID=61149 RepID=A0A2P2J6F3_RHIMU
MRIKRKWLLKRLEGQLRAMMILLPPCLRMTADMLSMILIL